jgi:hypothetical protein
MSASHPMNESRASWAWEVVEAFGSITGADIYEEAIGDLLCDIGHLCDEERLDFLAVVRKAVAYWKIEQVDPVGIADPPAVTIIIDEADSPP